MQTALEANVLCALVAFTAATTACVDASSPSEQVEVSESELIGNGPLDVARNEAGFVQSATASGTLDAANDFFQSLGTNGRACESCHHAAQGWSITPRQLQQLFARTDGLDPIFLPHDGANTPNADVSTTSARRSAYSLLLSRGTIRVGLPVKPTSEFTLLAVDDPYGWASATQLSLFRRPLPTTNLRFLSVINWDGRNSPADVTDLRLGLKNQANGATVNHAKAAAPIDDAIREGIVDFELQLTTAQIWQDDVGLLDFWGAAGGPKPLLTQPFALGANDPGAPGSTNEVFSIFDAWGERSCWFGASDRAAVADGQRVFNEKTFDIGGGRTGTCSGCHRSPNVGASSSFKFFDVGVSSAERRQSDVPLYTFQNTATGETLQTTDPGRALISGKWADMNRFKVPALRGLAARAPYFHDGSAPSISAVVDHYTKHFDIHFEGREKRHLEMFLESL